MRNPLSPRRAGSYFAACALAAAAHALWSATAGAQAEGLLPRVAESKPQPKDLVQASIGPSLVRAPGGGEAVLVSVRVAPQWHVYWRNPGDSGAAPKVTLILPEGWSAGEPTFPRPQVLGDEHERTFGYEGSVHLLVPVRRDRHAADAKDRVDVRGELSWLACRTSCVSGRTALSGQVSCALADAPTDRSWPATLPPGAHASLEGSGNARILRIDIPAGSAAAPGDGSGAAGAAAPVFVPDDCPGIRWDGGTGPFTLVQAPGQGWTLRAGCTVTPSDAPKGGIRVRGLVLMGRAPSDPALDVDIPVPGTPTLPVP